MLNDPMLWALVMVALMPMAVRRALARRLARTSTRWIALAGLVFPLGMAALVGGTLGFIGLTVASATLVFPCMAVIGRARRPWVRAGALTALALLWTFQLSTTVPFVRWGPDDATPFWFIDLFNRMVEAWLAPLVIRIGGQLALETTLDVLRAPLAALSHHLLGLHALTGGLVALVLYGALRPFAPELTPFPPPNRWRVPRWLLGLTVLAAVTCRIAPEASQAWILQELGVVALVSRGALLAWMLLPAGRTGRLTWVALMALTLLVPTTAWAIAALAALETLTAIAISDAGVPTTGLRFVGPALRRWLLPTALLAAVAPFVLMRLVAPPPPGFRLPGAAGTQVPSHRAPGVKHRTSSGARLRPPADDSPRLSETTATFTGSSGARLTVDRYEYPSILGVLPLTGKTPQEAEALCAARGQRLCTETQWKEACSAAGRNPYMLSARTFRQSSDAKWRLREVLASRCGLGSNALHPSGSASECVSGVGVVDIVGNAYEWVTLNPPGVWGLAGGYHGYQDLTLSSCDFTVRIHAPQIRDLDLSAVGFRCCES